MARLRKTEPVPLREDADGVIRVGRTRVMEGFRERLEGRLSSS